MALTPGARLGAHEISSSLGSGGMGEVYRARDTRLNREVALKVLPDAFLADPDRLARFKREAQVLASLNHPNIATIYGFEEADGIQALVLELVDGPTLADRIAQGPVPLHQVLPIARQIADAIDAAHEQGIIHRDLKPANIKLRADDTVKVLDFGLAKMIDVAGSGGSGRPGRSGGPGGLDITNSPTLTSPAMTRAGVILGTATYMSPEQARGATVDARTDIWAFGCVLYEMLAGQRAFPGDTTSDAIAAILEREPRWDRAGRDTRASSTPAAPMSRERLETPASPHRGRAN
jgi:serine/threonine protein kinase